ncbi:leucine--tRNA ligase [Corynebacterium jeikeium]|uniref:Leucine--tRNA ligase n=1 Tax=Corynebacterium jeikeium (strain K411) TaxID=306537 RepID=SYL_CORJK|nr:class I tRNA ligase family protein [Corynebacterium jeikeium]Q4JSF0.1 RecName: Full=Leucine--tRNA ligase; AltName: Full=Leucyl-tRNA synthetase; Short=LeuRS [Corynebacterium jeikeium K411]EEW15608.1 leucine--tRNA ligase [Corynebacterium jeikeium ATCC 43734]OOD34725.1 leucine--tRNA ligase [Corynebacterium jeikeium]WCZ54728.1 Leucine--tRNA ligase [Corynebacterium jeikeium]CAI38257.1 leuS [Corynebacterium jeikeium K411]SUY82170.1 leucyl-tRNA synthetase [Corynebacterium jeikeium]
MTNGSTEDNSYRYTPGLAAKIEAKWQKHWADKGTFNAPNPTGDLAEPGAELPEDRKFIQDMFPYPSGVGLHVGHPLGYIGTDVFARFHRMKGANVLHTLGYDAFGLPAEQYAVQTGTHPRTTTMANIANMERQLGRLGLGHDKRRSFATTDTDYYRWTQWIFLQIYNSWFDPEAKNANGTLGKARPIKELEEKLAAERADWADLSAAEKQEILDSYRLVYRSNSTVNWCPGLGTVLANEEVTAEGRSERGNFPVFRKNLQQWMMRITAYSDRLIDDLEYLDWPEKVKSMQRNWIGRSRGAEVTFDCLGNDIDVFTTRPDTLFGATYMVLAPEHELVDTLVAQSGNSSSGSDAYTDVDPRWTYGQANPAAAVEAYRAAIAAKSDLERQENKEKTGVFLGVYATNPVNGAQVPVFIADYVLTGYGTGAIMAVPAHDSRDFEFATEFGLPIVPVLAPEGAEAGAGEQGGAELTEAFTEDGPHINSNNSDGLELNGLGKAEAIDKAIEWLESKGVGSGKIQYKLRDWLFARQRYWGEPFPIVYDEDGTAHGLPEDMLPVELPEVEDYKPVSFDPDDKDSAPQPPLAKAKDWVEVTLDLGDGEKTYYRDTNVMPQWAGSSWYQLRYIDPNNDNALVDIENERYWVGPREGRPSGGVDLYVGGVEHAVLHLLYARFWHKVLFDLGVVSSFEPYYRLYNQGYIQAYAYTDSRGVYVPAEEVTERDGKFFWVRKADDAEGVTKEEEVFQEYGKMGKSLKNAVSPDEICDDYGADTLRVYEMAMGPLDTSRPWATKDVVGAQRFLQRAWRLAVDENTGKGSVSDDALTDEDLKALHRTIAGVHENYAELRDNTAVAKLIEYVNYLTKTYSAGQAPRAAVEPLVQMLSPVAPHIAEEMWEILGHSEGITYESFPEWDEKWLVDDTIELPVQVMGKLRGRINVAADASREDIEAAALEEPNVASHIEGKTVAKIIVVPGKMVNIVAK